MKPALFLDRDGVIIENSPTYIRRWEDVQVFPQALQALVKSANIPFLIILITNQSGVGRGLFSLETAWEINNRLVEMIKKAGGRVDGVYMCPHAPEENCTCRKPQPGLLLQAAHELNIDLAHSIMIGDAFSDLKAGQSAGIRTLAIVRTGRGATEVEINSLVPLAAYQIFGTLAEALEALL